MTTDYSKLDHETLDRIASEYVLGTLSAEKRHDIQKALAGNPTLAAAIAAWEEKLLPLTALAPEVQPSEQLWPRIQSSLRLGAQQVKAGWHWWTSLGLWRGLSAGGFATAAVLAFVLLTQKPADTRYMVVLVAPQDKAPGWVVQASANNKLKLIPLGRLKIPADKSLQFWTKGEDWKGPVSLGLVKSGQSAEVTLDKLPPLQPNQLFEITLEPYAGSPLNRPTGPILHIGRAVQVM